MNYFLVVNNFEDNLEDGEPVYHSEIVQGFVDRISVGKVPQNWVCRASSLVEGSSTLVGKLLIMDFVF